MTPVFDFDLDASGETDDFNKPKIHQILNITTTSRATLIELAESILAQAKKDKPRFNISVSGRLTKWNDDEEAVVSIER